MRLGGEHASPKVQAANVCHIRCASDWGLTLDSDLRFNDVREVDAHHAKVTGCALSDLGGLGADGRQRSAGERFARHLAAPRELCLCRYQVIRAREQARLRMWRAPFHCAVAAFDVPLSTAFSVRAFVVLLPPGAIPGLFQLLSLEVAIWLARR